MHRWEDKFVRMNKIDQYSTKECVLQNNTSIWSQVSKKKLIATFLDCDWFSAPFIFQITSRCCQLEGLNWAALFNWVHYSSDDRCGIIAGRGARCLRHHSMQIPTTKYLTLTVRCSISWNLHYLWIFELGCVSDGYENLWVKSACGIWRCEAQLIWWLSDFTRLGDVL